MTGRSHTNEMRVVEVNLTISTDAYSANDLIGSVVIELEGVGDNSVQTGGLIQSVVIADKGKQNANIDVVFVDAALVATLTDNAAFDPTDADIGQIIGVVTVTDWKSFSDNSVGQALQLAIPFVMDAGNTLLAVFVARSAGTWGANDLTLRVGILGD